jgi:hypothetical protein
MEVENAGGRPAVADLEAHAAGGALLGGKGGGLVHLAPGGGRSYQLEAGAWLKVREHIPANAGPVVAARGISECIDGDVVRSSRLEPAFAMRNPWFAGEPNPTGGVILLINAGAAPVQAAGCYSAGNLYSLPRADRGPPRFEPVCSETFEIEIAPFATREFPLERNGSRWFRLQTRGDSIVLQMLRPLGTTTRQFVVDSTIRFGGEVTSR